MNRQLIMRLTVLAAAAVAVSAATLAARYASSPRAAGPSSVSPHVPGQSARGATVCRLRQLRVVRVTQARANDVLGGGNDIVQLRFVNDGPTCTVGGRFRFAVGATTTTHAAIGKRLSQTLRLVPQQALTLNVAMWWMWRSSNRPCDLGRVLSLVFRGSGGSKTVSLRHLRGRFFVCTPLSELYLAAPR